MFTWTFLQILILLIGDCLSFGQSAPEFSGKFLRRSNVTQISLDHRHQVLIDRADIKWQSWFYYFTWFIYLFSARKADRCTGVGWKECSLKFKCLKRVHVLHIVCECFTGKKVIFFI